MEHLSIEPPALKECMLQCEMEKGLDPTDGFEFRIYIRYDEKAHVSGVLDLTAASDFWCSRIGILRDHKISYSGPEREQCFTGRS